MSTGLEGSAEKIVVADAQLPAEFPPRCIRVTDSKFLDAAVRESREFSEDFVSKLISLGQWGMLELYLMKNDDFAEKAANFVLHMEGGLEMMLDNLECFRHLGVAYLDYFSKCDLSDAQICKILDCLVLDSDKFKQGGGGQIFLFFGSIRRESYVELFKSKLTPSQ